LEKAKINRTPRWQKCATGGAL